MTWYANYEFSNSSIMPNLGYMNLCFGSQGTQAHFELLDRSLEKWQLSIGPTFYRVWNVEFDNVA